MSCGILLALSDDPLSRITVAITKQEFSTIGYFYSYGEKIKVFLRDPFGLPLYRCNDLNSLLSSPLLRRLALRPVKPELEKSFRLALTKIDRAGLREMKEGIYHLFGFPSSTKYYSSLGVVSNILTRMGKSLVNSNINTLYGSGYEDCIAPPKDKGGIEGVVQVLSYLAASFNQNTSPEVTTQGRKLPWQIQSFILDEEIFLPLQEVKLNTSLEERKEQLKKVFHLQKPRLEEGLKLFLTMLSDPGFLFLISRGSYNQSQKLLQETLIEVRDFFPRLREVIKKRPLLEELEFQDFKISTLLGKKELKEKKESLPDPLTTMKEVLLASLEEGKDLDLRVLLDVYQELSGEELRFSSKKVKGKYFLSSGSIGIILKSGDRLDLPLSNPDLSSFDYETLLEILENLDNLSRDSSYDELRVRIAEELASYSSFSLKKH